MAMFRGSLVALVLMNTEGWVSYPIGKRTLNNLQQMRMAEGSLNDFNVVLRPSDDDEAFDSLKIGSAKVHRYSLDTDPDCETEYVM